MTILQQQVLMSHELRSLKAQMQEMKEMLKMSFDMQLDIQRAIHQEVAAAIAANFGMYNYHKRCNTNLPSERMYWMLPNSSLQHQL